MKGIEPMKQLHCLILGLVFPALLFLPNVSFAHGVQVEYQTSQTYTIRATFDNGEPLNNGQVTIYSPNEPNQPWKTGTTNEKGEYLFSPDPSMLGEWYIQVRKAGHGGNTTIDTMGNSDGGAASFSALQKVVMIGSVLWGILGTTLYFRRKS